MDALDVLCAQLTRDLSAIAKFLLFLISYSRFDISHRPTCAFRLFKILLRIRRVLYTCFAILLFSLCVCHILNKDYSAIRTGELQVIRVSPYFIIVIYAICARKT